MYRNIITLFSCLILLFSCKQFQSTEQKEGTGCDEIKYEVLENVLADVNKENVEIYFTASFINDSIIIVNEDVTLYEKTINTDHTIGTADYLKITKSNNLKLSVNNCGRIELGNLENYNYIYIELKNEEECIVTKTGKERFFK